MVAGAVAHSTALACRWLRRARWEVLAEVLAAHPPCCWVAANERSGYGCIWVMTRDVRKHWLAE
jgi:hypothetical protein